MDAKNMRFNLGLVGTLIAAVVSMTLYISRVEAKAEAAATQATQANQSLSEMTKEMARQRELIAQIQGDSRAILQILRLRRHSPQ